MKVIVGLSGGVDSCWALKTAIEKNYEVVAAVTFDNHWDTEIATGNRRKVCSHFGVPNKVYTAPKEEFFAIQRAFLYASTMEAEAPSDLGIRKTLIDAMDEFGVERFITGGNKQTEGQMPKEWSMIDGRYLRDVCKKFRTDIVDFKVLSLRDQYRYNKHVLRILETIDYDPEIAKKELKKLCGWQDYGKKHEESVYTRFVRGLRFYKFGIDVRIVEYKAKVNAGLMTVADMIKELSKPIVTPQQFLEDCATVEDALHINMESVLKRDMRTYREFKTYRENPLVRAARWIR